MWGEGCVDERGAWMRGVRGQEGCVGERSVWYTSE